MSDEPQLLPYGISDYTLIRRSNMAYVDKTGFISALERIGRYLFFLRPRRFGKSLTMTILRCYYDQNYADQFKEWFGGTEIGRRPTPEKNKYLMLHFDFSMVKSDPAQVESSFEWHVKLCFEDFLIRYADLMDDRIVQQIEAAPSASARLDALFQYAALKELKLYLVIDEYDNFTNTILTIPNGNEVYTRITHSAGFFRDFFKVLKGGTTGPNAGLARLLITGVSPVTMDDVTSGFNIGKQVSLSRQLAQLTGFTREQVKRLVIQQDAAGILGLSVEDIMALMEDWYGGYRFGAHAEEPLFNPDMVLYFLGEVVTELAMPHTMIDHNVRIDYEKLRHLVVVDNKLNGNFSRLKHLIENGFFASELVTAFPLEQISKEQNFMSLLYYFGLVTQRGEHNLMPRLEIPNRTIATLMFGYLREALKDGGLFDARISQLQQLLNQMAVQGEWEPFFKYLAHQIKDHTGIHDYLSGDKVIQGFLLAWSTVTDYFLVQSEVELNKGYGDLLLAPFLARYASIQHGYLVEIKYLPRSSWTEELQRTKVEEARLQLISYLQDPKLTTKQHPTKWHPLILVFRGWELVAMEEVVTDGKKEPAT